MEVFVAYKVLIINSDTFLEFCKEDKTNIIILTYKQVNILHLKNLLVQKYDIKLNKIGEKKFIEINGSDGLAFKKGEFKLD